MGEVACNSMSVTRTARSGVDRRLPGACGRGGRGSGLERSADAFDDGGDALADTDAHGRETITAAAFFHFVNQRRHYARAAAAKRMAEGDGAAVHVQLIQVDLQLPNASKNLRGKGLVHFDEIDLLHGESGSLERLLGRRNRPDAHIIG